MTETGPATHEQADGVPSPAPASSDDRARVGTVGVLGGTGGQGRGIAYRLGRAGFDVVIGSRDAARGATAAREALPVREGNGGTDNRSCAARADVVVLAVPWVAHEETLRALALELAGKVVVDCCNPLEFEADGAHPVRVPEGSAAEQAAALVPTARVVGAFHHVSSRLLLDAAQERMPSLDILITSDHPEAAEVVRTMVDSVPGLRGVYAGALRHARQVESLSATLISLSQQHQTYTGVTIHGV